jgi:3'-phosphoadenosine 5'-phosphosulfate sulfotransferase (PAPS reductase)/FAD synthetase
MGEMISFGGGVNSVAMTIMLIEQGWRGPIVFADTGSEWPETYCYMRYFEREWLKPRGLEGTILPPGSAWHQKERDCSLEDYCKRWSILPLLSTRWCSVRWKRDPIHAWAAAHPVDVQLLGISADEPRRIRDDPGVRYPLYEEDITRRECQRIIQRAGLDIPFKSGCFFCPGQALADWRRLYTEHPDLYERAALLEERASAKHNKKATLDSHGISLREHAARRWAGQMQMDLSQWLPCLCSL